MPVYPSLNKDPWISFKRAALSRRKGALKSSKWRHSRQIKEAYFTASVPLGQVQVQGRQQRAEACYAIGPRRRRNDAITRGSTTFKAQ